jgi:hypothetical protein
MGSYHWHLSVKLEYSLLTHDLVSKAGCYKLQTVDYKVAVGQPR